MPRVKVMLEVCHAVASSVGQSGGHLANPFPRRVCKHAGQPLTHWFSALTGGGQGKFEHFYFPAKAWLVLTPFLPLGAAIQPSLDLEVIPINIYENFMIKRRISPFIFQTCPNTHHLAPKSCPARQELPPWAGVSQDAHPKTGGNFTRSVYPPGPSSQHQFNISSFPFSLKIHN